MKSHRRIIKKLYIEYKRWEIGKNRRKSNLRLAQQTDEEHVHRGEVTKIL